MFWINLSSVEPELLKTAVRKLEEVHLTWSKLTCQQVEALFATDNEATKLKSLTIAGNNLSSVEPALLATALSKLEKVNILECSLTRKQAETLFVTKNVATKLKYLNLGKNYSLPTIEPALLATVMNKLEVVKLHGAPLTVEQITCLLTQAVQGSLLQDLCLDMRWAWGVDRKIIKQAKQKIKRFKIYD